MATFSPMCPFIRLGGNTHVSAEEIYRTIRANLGPALDESADSYNAIEDKAFGRALNLAARAIDRRVAQGDPTKLSSLLERWEAILAIVPPNGATGYDRRNAVAARLRYQASSASGAIASIAARAFDPWTTRVHLTPKADAVMWWPGGPTALPDLFWYSTCAHICVEYELPATATQAEADRKRDSCLSALDEYAPAWATFCCSETLMTGVHAGEFGFFLDVSALDRTAFGA